MSDEMEKMLLQHYINKCERTQKMEIYELHELNKILTDYVYISVDLLGKIKERDKIIKKYLEKKAKELNYASFGLKEKRQILGLTYKSLEQKIDEYISGILRKSALSFSGEHARKLVITVKEHFQEHPEELEEK